MRSIHHSHLIRRAWISALICGATVSPLGAETDAKLFETKILPILENHCYSCHGEGEDKGKVSFDTFGSHEELLAQTDLWVHALKNVRSGVMPPAKKKRLNEQEMATLEAWIKKVPLKLDPLHPDPGRVTLRRLNRVEYRNTIRDLMGIDFRTDEEFPADDTGYGFDNIGDVLTTSPLLLEKYMQAAEVIVAKSVPVQPREIPQRELDASAFNNQRKGESLSVSLYDPLDISADLKIHQPGTYRVTLNAKINGSFAYDPGRADAEWWIAENRAFKQELKWENGKSLESTVEVKWQSGTYPLRFTMKPLVGKDQKPIEKPGDGPPSVNLNFRGITLVGPLEAEFAKTHPNYERFFTRKAVPEDKTERARYTEEVLRRFATRAFRRPVDDATVKRLSTLASESADMFGGSFERGIARAITAVIASPRFLFRMEETLPTKTANEHPLLDEFALASRLSYFLWSTMPDDTLFELAERGELRAQLTAQVSRMLKDERSNQFVKNFAGQWLQTRDVEGVSIDARIVLARDAGTEKEMSERYQYRQQLNQQIDRAKRDGDQEKLAQLHNELEKLRAKFSNRGQRIEFKGSLRGAMRREAELLFQHLLTEDRSLLELIDNDSTFLNEELAAHYGIPGVKGNDMRLVKLPPDSPRGGIITMGTVLAVTSNPTRTSPVKRGLFILDNILGTPPPPAPPNIPSLEASEKSADGKERTLREALALHREQPLCSSCHNRMDPLGLALENFNAMGSWRDQELGQPLESPAGKLITGETFADVRELKRLITKDRRNDYFQCITEKLLTFSLGRGPQACDISTVDDIVAKLHATDGKFSTLIMGIIESPAFQRRHRNEP